jgi:hypothetical protein
MKCDQEGNKNPQNQEQKELAINLGLIVAVDEINKRVFTHERAIKINGEYFTDLIIAQSFNLDSL